MRISIGQFEERFLSYGVFVTKFYMNNIASFNLRVDKPLTAENYFQPEVSLEVPSG